MLNILFKRVNFNFKLINIDYLCFLRKMKNNDKITAMITSCKGDASGTP